MSVTAKLKPPPPPPVSTTIGSSGHQQVDGVLSGVMWASTTLTYSFPNDHSDYGNGYPEATSKKFAALVSAEQTAVGSILGQVSAFADLTFNNVTATDDASALIRIGKTNTNGADSWAYYPGNGRGGDVWIDKGTGASGLVRHGAGDLDPGDYSYTLFMHELGHAFGLKHSFERGSFGVVPDGTDSLEYTVMSYDAYVGASSTWATDGNNPQTFMMYDIAALQFMYGANYSTNETATTYRWDSSGALSINGGTPVDAALGSPTIFMTIWDGGGNDTYDFSNYTTDLRVDLSPGGWTTLDMSPTHLQLANLAAHSTDPAIWAAGNIANALVFDFNKGATESGAGLIENATGGIGADTIIGNEADNILNGGAGADVMTGGAGADRFDLVQGEADGDTITDFSTDSGDVMRFSGYNIVSAALLYDTGDAWIVSDGGAHAPETIHLTGVAALAAGDYLFV